MSLRDEAMQAHPDFPWLDAEDLESLRRYLNAAKWLAAGESVLSCEPAGEGNMNLTLRVRTSQRSFILKQARPWVEKYDHIPAPWDRSRSEQVFYARAEKIPGVASRMPTLLGRDADARVLLLEDLPEASDLSSLYSLEPGKPLLGEEIDELAAYLTSLHEASEGEPDPELANREMRALNHQHIFEIPVSEDNGITLDDFESGLAEAARGLRGDPSYREKLRETGERYLADGRCLVHGDFFPGSWLRTKNGLRIIDPEFGFWGDPELDLGVALAHLAMAQQPKELAERLLAGYGRPFAREWLARYASAEIMRRLIGVAQLPLPPTTDFRAPLLERSHRSLLELELDRLWE